MLTSLMSVFWSDLTDKRRYAIFSANVIVSEDEQEISAEDWDAIETKHFPFLDSKAPIIIGDDDLPHLTNQTWTFDNDNNKKPFSSL